MKQVLLSIILALALTSCGATMNLGGKLKNVEIGMAKQELISTLGKSYSVKGAVKTPDGTLETLSFTDAMSQQVYVFNFLNGKLVEWFEEMPPPNTVVNERDRDHDRDRNHNKNR